MRIDDVFSSVRGRGTSKEREGRESVRDRVGTPKETGGTPCPGRELGTRGPSSRP